MKARWAKALCLLALGLPALSCDGGLRLVVVERSEASALGAAGKGGAPGGAGSSNTAGTPSVIPNAGTPSVGGNVDPGQGGAAGMPDDMAGAAGMPDVPIWDRAALYTASFSSYLSPDQYVRWVDNEGFIAPIDLASSADKIAATFEVTPGLADEVCFSFRALPKPAKFLRHANSRIYLNAATDVPLYLEDATFCEKPGLADPAGVTYVPRGYLKRTLHIRNQNELWIDDVPDPAAPEYAAFAAASTFYRQPALSETPSP